MPLSSPISTTEVQNQFGQPRSTEQLPPIGTLMKFLQFPLYSDSGASTSNSNNYNYWPGFFKKDANEPFSCNMWLFIHYKLVRIEMCKFWSY